MMIIKYQSFILLVLMVLFSFVSSLILLNNLNTNINTDSVNEIVNHVTVDSETNTTTITSLKSDLVESIVFTTNVTNSKKEKLMDQINVIDNFFVEGNRLQVGYGEITSLDVNDLQICGEAGNKLTIQASNDIGTDAQVLKFPTSSTLSNTYLKNDGTGNLNWEQLDSDVVYPLISNPSGSLISPSIAFTDNQSAGLYYELNRISTALNGVKIVEINPIESVFSNVVRAERFGTSLTGKFSAASDGTMICSKAIIESSLNTKTMITTDSTISNIHENNIVISTSPTPIVFTLPLMVSSGGRDVGRVITIIKTNNVTSTINTSGSDVIVDVKSSLANFNLATGKSIKFLSNYDDLSTSTWYAY